MKRIGFVAVVLLLTVAPLLTSCKKKEEAPAPAMAPAAPMTTTTGAPMAPAAPAAPAAPDTKHVLAKFAAIRSLSGRQVGLG